MNRDRMLTETTREQELHTQGPHIDRKYTLTRNYTLTRTTQTAYKKRLNTQESNWTRVFLSNPAFHLPTFDGNQRESETRDLYTARTPWAWPSASTKWKRPGCAIQALLSLNCCVRSGLPSITKFFEEDTHDHLSKSLRKSIDHPFRHQSMPKI